MLSVMCCKPSYSDLGGWSFLYIGLQSTCIVISLMFILIEYPFKHSEYIILNHLEMYIVHVVVQLIVLPQPNVALLRFITDFIYF